MEEMLKRMGIIDLVRRMRPTLNIRLQQTLDDDGEDPFAGVREPRQRDPRGPRSASVALEEPYAPPCVQALGTDPQSRRIS